MLLAFLSPNLLQTPYSLFYLLSDTETASFTPPPLVPLKKEPVEPSTLMTFLPGDIYLRTYLHQQVVKNQIKQKRDLLSASPSSFNRGHLSGSVNLPYSSAFGPDGELVQCPGTGILHSFRGRVIVVISHAMKSGTTVRRDNCPGTTGGLTEDQSSGYGDSHQKRFLG